MPAIKMNGLYDAEYLDLESDIVGDVFRIFVGSPPSTDDSQAHPVIFTLDANASFASVLGTQRLLTQGGQVPPSYVVGIGYPGDSLAAAMSNRNRDYVPSSPGEAEINALGPGVEVGADAFHRFLQDELKPMLERRYAVDLSDSTLMGTSLGGLFGAWVLLTRPGSFRRFVLSSPSLWWREEQVWDWESAYADRFDDLPATLFVGAGELETESHMRAAALDIARKNAELREHVEGMIRWSDEHGWPRVAELTTELEQRLLSRNYPNLHVLARNLPDEDHMSAPPALSSRGLRYVFGSWRPEDASC